jgi:hypothetical protein
VIAHLVGRWTVRRRLTDLRAGIEGAFEGVAEIGADGRWAESGRLRFGGYDGEARRVLRIVEGPWRSRTAGRSTRST